jgi:HlyD family secretion protein
MRALIVLIVLAGLGGGGWFGYKKWYAVPEKITYREAEVRRGTVISTVTATGTVQPLKKVLVGSQVSGTVMEWFADFNDKVTEGFVLAQLDQDRFNAQREQREAAVKVAAARVKETKANQATSELDLKRIQNAFERQAASDYELEAAKAADAVNLAAVAQAEAQLESAKAELRMALVELDKTTIKSPIDGVVISRDVDAGQTVAASLSAPTLFTIANDLKKMQIQAAVNETDIGKVSKGIETEFRVDAYPDRRYKGVVAQVRYAETVVDNVVTYTTLIDVDNEDLTLRPGMTATVLFQVAKAEDVLMVPNAALRFDPQAAAPQPAEPFRPTRSQPMRPRVHRLVNGALVEVPVELGLNDGSFTEVRSTDLAAGDKIVLEQNMRGGPGGRPPAQRMPRM